jgi:hypothetical protein
MTVFFKVHHKFDTSIQSSFRQSNADAINKLLSTSGAQLSSETVVIKTEEDFLDLDLQTLNIKFVNKRGLRNPPAGWLPGEIGIWVSNIQALKCFLKESLSNSDVCLLVENDVWLAPEEGALIESIKEWVEYLPRDWDFLNLYVAENWRYKFIPEIHEISHHTVCRNYAEIHFAAILWSKAGSNKLINLSETEIHSPIDRQVFEDSNFQGYAIKPDFHRNVSVWTAEALNNSTIQDSPVRIRFSD